jgi:hypothetical protein
MLQRARDPIHGRALVSVRGLPLSAGSGGCVGPLGAGGWLLCGCRRTRTWSLGQQGPGSRLLLKRPLDRLAVRLLRQSKRAPPPSLLRDGLQSHMARPLKTFWQSTSTRPGEWADPLIEGVILLS